MDGTTYRSDAGFCAHVRQQVVVTAATGDDERTFSTFSLNLEDEARVIFKLAAKGGLEAKAARVEAKIFHGSEALLIVINGPGKAGGSLEACQLTDNGIGDARDFEIGAQTCNIICRQGGLGAILELAFKPCCNLFHLTAADKRQALCCKLGFNNSGCWL